MPKKFMPIKRLYDAPAVIPPQEKAEENGDEQLPYPANYTEPEPDGGEQLPYPENYTEPETEEKPIEDVYGGPDMFGDMDEPDDGSDEPAPEEAPSDEEPRASLVYAGPEAFGQRLRSRRKSQSHRKSRR